MTFESASAVLALHHFIVDRLDGRYDVEGGEIELLIEFRVVCIAYAQALRSEQQRGVNRCSDTEDRVFEEFLHDLEFMEEMAARIYRAEVLETVKLMLRADSSGRRNVDRVAFQQPLVKGFGGSLSSQAFFAAWR